MKRIWLEKVIRLLDLPADTDVDVPRITVLGREKMLAENVAGLGRCTQEEILLQTGAGLLEIRGENLRVKELGESRAMVEGRLRCWAFRE